VARLHRRYHRAVVHGFSIGGAEPADLPGCAALQASHSGRPVADSEDGLRQELTRSDRWLLVAIADDTVAGYGRVSDHRPERPGPAEAPPGYYLGGVVVDPRFRRRGIGLALTRARMELVFTMADEVWYFTNARNAASIAMHGPLGFVEVTRDFTFPGVTFEGGQGILFRASSPAPRHTDG
jgi:ribosomal protein S18 acetylase RimI-like enzyme